MAAIILLAFRVGNMFQVIRGDETRIQAGEMTSERAPLLSHKDDDLLSWGSSYDSISHDEEEIDEWLAVASLLDGKPQNEGEAKSSRRLCVICFDAPRDCFFLPCGHCTVCFTCGSRFVLYFHYSTKFCSVNLWPEVSVSHPMIFGLTDRNFGFVFWVSKSIQSVALTWDHWE